MTAVPVPRQAVYKPTRQILLAMSLRLSGWLAVNLLVSFGVVGLVAFTIGSFSIAGMMHHLANLASRYIVAGADRQHQFDMILLWSVSGAFCASGFFRRHSLMQVFFKESVND
ncbi:hypothetical protein [Pseudomonas sp.]|uniref:hypothetical protein n=1 Tax=Pseudomonas sp. TaxID=306 RepID=UPI003D10A782